MKRRMWGLGLCAALLLPCLQPAAEELLQNGNFEGVDEQANRPLHWILEQKERVEFVKEGQNHYVRFKDGGRLKCMMDVKPEWKWMHVSARMRTVGIKLGPEAWNRPRIALTWTTKDKQVYRSVNQNEDRDWSQREAALEVPPDALKLQVQVGLFECQGILEIDDVSLTSVTPEEARQINDQNSQQRTAVSPTGGTGPAAQNGKGVSSSNPQTSAPVPTFKIQNEGIEFNADMAQRLLTRRTRPDGKPSTVLSVGPGCPGSAHEPKERKVKFPSTWQVVDTPPGMGGAEAAPDVLVLKLPDVLQDKKPEVVLLWGDVDGKRSASPNERYDWEDAIVVCLRMGVLPVLILPNGHVTFAGVGGDVGLIAQPKKNEQEDAPDASGDLDALRRTIIMVGNMAAIPMMEQAPFATTSERIDKTLYLIEKHILGRTPAERKTASDKPNPDKPGSDENE